MALRWAHLTLLVLPAIGQAQGVRLADRIERPMVYVAHDAGAGEPAGGAAAGGNPILELLTDPRLGEALGGPSPAFGFLRRVVRRAAGEIELCLTGIVPAGVGPGGDRPGMPLLVVRAHLTDADADRLRAVLADPAAAEPARTLGGHQVYRLRTRTEGAGGAPGYRVEAAVVGPDLVVANHGSGLDEALGAATAAARRALATDPRYLALRERLEPAAGAIVLFADWQRFGPRLASLGGLSGALLDWSGLGGADAVLASVEPRRSEDGTTRWQSTVLLSFPDGSAIDGWLALVEPAPARQLLGELPAGGLGGVVLSIEPQRLVQGARRLGFARALSGRCGECGLDLDRVVRRLGRRGAAQWLWLPAAAGAAGGDGMATAFALQARSRRAATDLLDEIGRAAAERQRGALLRGELRGARPQVELTGVGGIERLRLGAVDDLLLFAQDPRAVAVLADDRRERTRAPLEAAVAETVHAFSGTKLSLAQARVGGIVHFDAGTWLAAAGLAPDRPAPDGPSPDGPPPDRPAGVARDGAAGLPTRHTGLLDVLGGEGNGRTVVRLQLLSSP